MIITIIVAVMIGLSVRRGLKNGLVMEAKRVMAPIVSFVVSFIGTPFINTRFNANGTTERVVEQFTSEVDKLNVSRSAWNLITSMGGYSAPKLVMPIISFILCFIISTVILTIVFRRIDILARFPIVNQMNYTLGGVVGLLTALIRLWMIVAVIRMLTWEEAFAMLYNEILKAPLVSWIATSNPIIDYAIGLVSVFD